MNNNINTVSSDDVIASYRELLTEANDKISVLRAQVTKLQRLAMAASQPAEPIRHLSEEPPGTKSSALNEESKALQRGEG